jgi:hypothetical protein
MTLSHYINLKIKSRNAASRTSTINKLKLRKVTKMTMIVKKLRVGD